MLMIVSAQVFMPCMDGICEQNNKGEIEFTMAGETEYQEMGHEDHCSPFCTCVCCHSNYVSSEQNSKSNLQPYSGFEVNPLTSLHSSYLDRIWQPPKA